MNSDIFLVGVYTENQPISFKLDSSSLRVEDVCKECALRLQIDIPLIQMFSLFHIKRKIWLSPNQKLTPDHCGKDVEYMFRIRFHPEIPIKNDRFTRYLRLQFRHCFTQEFEVDKMKNSNLVFGLGIFDMLTDSYEKGWTRRSNVFQWKRYKRFFPKDKLNDYNIILKCFLLFNLRRRLLEKHREYNGNYRIQGMAKTYVEKIRNEFYSKITKEIYTYQDKAGNERKVTVGEKDSEFVVCFEEEIYCLKLVRSVKIQENMVEIFFVGYAPKMFKMDLAISKSFVSAMDGYYRFAYNYHYGICEDLLSPRIKALQEKDCYDSITEDDVAEILMKTEKENSFLKRMRPNDTETYDVFALDKENSRVLKYTVGPNESLEDLRKTHPFLEHILKPQHFEFCNLLYCHKTVSPKEPSTSALERNNQMFLPSEISFLEERPFHQGVFTETFLAKIEDSKMSQVGIKTLIDFEESYLYTQIFMEGISCMLEMCKCPSFLQVKGFIMEPHLGLVTELPTESVIDYLSDNDELPLKYILEMAITVAEGLVFLRKQGIVHGDISCENLQKIGSTIKITDASIVNKVHLLPKDSVIYKSRLPWLDPLLLNILSEPTFESDIFSYGTLLCQLLCLKCKPPKEQTTNQFPCRLLFNISKDDEKTQNACTVRKKLQEIISKCRSFKAEDRPQPENISSKLNDLIHEPSMQERLPMDSAPDNGLCDHHWHSPPISTGEISAAIKKIQEKTRKSKAPKPAPAYEVDRKNLEIIEPIGEGAFGKVYSAYYSTPTQKIKVAVKMDNCKAKLNISELEIMHKLKHDRVVNFIGICSQNSRWIIMEYVGGGDLHSKLKKSKTLIPNLKNILLGITEGMVYLKTMRVIHRDLAARNILLTENNDVKITDFGLSKMTDGPYYRVKTGRCVPMFWSAPDQSKISSKTDVWSFGVVMWECYSLGAPPILLKTEIFREFVEVLRKGRRLPKPVKCPEVMYKMMRDCWEFETDKRPDFESLRERILVEA